MRIQAEQTYDSAPDFEFTLLEIGEALGRSKSVADYLITRALRKLRWPPGRRPIAQKGPRRKPDHLLSRPRRTQSPAVA